MVCMYVRVFSTYRKIGRSNFEGVHRLEHRTFALVPQVVKRRFFCHEVRVAYDGPHKEPEISRFLASRYLLTTVHKTYITN